MDKIDRLGWAEGISFSPSGADIGIRTNDAEYLPRLKEIVSSHGWELSDEEIVQLLVSLRVGPEGKKGKRNYSLLYMGTSQVARSLDVDEVFGVLESILPELVRATAKDSVFIPGSVVKWMDKLLVLPANGGTGRKTLLEELEKNQASVLARSFFSISPEGELRLDDVEIEDESEKIICFTEYVAKNKSLRARSLTPGESSLYLFSMGVSSRSQPALALSAVSSFASGVPSLKGNRGDVKQAVKYLSKKIDGLSSSRN